MATNKYWNSYIYVIRTTNKEGGEVSLYVGSTTNFDKRKGSHKSNIYNETGKEYHRKLYTKIRSNSGDWNMDVYKHFRCENKKELEMEEERIRVDLDADLNTKVCSTGLNTKEKVVEYQRIYKTNNKEKILEYQRIYSTNNKEKLSENKKVHYANNREKVAEQKKIYYAKNKKIISEKSKVRYINNKEKKKKEIF